MGRIFAKLRSAGIWALCHPIRAVLLGLLFSLLVTVALIVWVDYCGRCELAEVIAEADREWPEWQANKLGDGEWEGTASNRWDNLFNRTASVHTGVTAANYDSVKSAVAFIHLNTRFEPNRKLSPKQIETIRDLRQQAIQLGVSTFGRNWRPDHTLEDRLGNSLSHPESSHSACLTGAILHLEATLLLQEDQSSAAIERLAIASRLLSLWDKYVGEIPIEEMAVLQREICLGIEEVLAAGEIDLRQAEMLADLVRSGVRDTQITRTIETTRGHFHEFMSSLERANSSGSFMDAPLFVLIYRFQVRSDHARGLRFQNELLRAARQDEMTLHRQCLESGATMERDSLRGESWRFRNVYAQLYAHATNQSVFDYFGRRARNRCIHALIEADRMRLSQGKWPESPRDLVAAGQLQSDWDPHLGGPLDWKREPNVVTIRSVDDVVGGIQFRLWTPDQRGLPPISNPMSNNDTTEELTNRGHR